MAAGVLSSREPSTERSWRAATAAAAASTVPPPIQALDLQRLQVRVVPFYYPGKPDVWHERLGSGPLGNFVRTSPSSSAAACVADPSSARQWPAPLTVTLDGITGTFTTSEAAYQAMKWWDNDAIRAAFEAAPDGEAAFQLKLQFEAEQPPGPSWSAVASLGEEGGARVAAIDKWTAMLVVLEAKFAEPRLRDALLSTGDALLLEHNPEPVRTPDSIDS